MESKLIRPDHGRDGGINECVEQYTGNGVRHLRPDDTFKSTGTVSFFCKTAQGEAGLPQIVAEMRTSIQQRADRLLDEIERAETCDFVSEYAHPLPSLVIFDLLGVPAEYHDTIRESIRAGVTFQNAVYKHDFKAMEYIAERFAKTGEVLQRVIRERQRQPKNDLISILMHGDAATPQLPDDELVVLCNFLLTAGHETTANLLSGSLRYLLERRELWEQLSEAREMIPPAVEELLRFVSPVLGSLGCQQRTWNWVDMSYGKERAYNLELARQSMIPVNFQIQRNWILCGRR